MATLGWFTILYLLASLFWDGNEKKDKQSNHAVAVGLVIGTAFLLTADLMLVIIQPSAIPIAIPQFWLERIGFLWPLSLGALLFWRLSETGKIRFSTLLVLLIFCLAFGLKEYRWESRIDKVLMAADEAAQAGDNLSARKQLEQVRGLNTRKQKPGVIPAMRKIRAQLYLQENNILGAFFEVKHCLKEDPQETENLLPLLDCSRMQQVAKLPLTRLNDLRLMVDMEPSLDPEHSFVLDRWGRVFLNTNGTFQQAFNDSLQPCIGEDPADLEILPGDRGAVVMSKHGHFFFHGEVPDSVRSLLETARIPSQTYVDFEFTPSMEGAWLLSDRGPIIAIGKTQVEIPYEDQIQWPYSIARDLEVEPSGKGLYLMDGLGSVHTFGETSVNTTGLGQPYWTYECAVDIEWLPDKKGFYLLTNWGEVYVVGDGLTRNAYKIPKALQAIKDMPYAIALQVSLDANRVDILESNGGITQVTRHIQNPEEWLESIQQKIATGHLREAVQSVQQFVDIAPEQAESALDLLDATFCHNYASTPLLTESDLDAADEEPDTNFAVAVDVEQTDRKGVCLILDRWGRIWQYDGSSYILKKSVIQYGPDTGPATDLEWIPSSSTGLILYDRGAIEIWGKGDNSTAGIFDEVQPTGEGWIDLEPVGDGRSWVVANAFGGFHVLGRIDFTLPDVGTFSWGDVRLGKDIEIGSSSGAVYLLDGNGGLHAFGQAAFPIKGEGYPLLHKGSLPRTGIPAG